MDWWRSNAPRMKSDLTSLIISGRGHARDLRPKIYRMSKAALVRGAFAIQCTLSVPPVISAVSRCSHCMQSLPLPHSKVWYRGESNLAKCRQDDLCCRRTIRRWNPEARSFRLMYGTPAADENFFIHTPVSTKRTVPLGPESREKPVCKPIGNGFRTNHPVNLDSAPEFWLQFIQRCFH